MTHPSERESVALLGAWRAWHEAVPGLSAVYAERAFQAGWDAQRNHRRARSLTAVLAIANQIVERGVVAGRVMVDEKLLSDLIDAFFPELMDDEPCEPS